MQCTACMGQFVLLDGSNAYELHYHGCTGDSKGTRLYMAKVLGQDRMGTVWCTCTWVTYRVHAHHLVSITVLTQQSSQVEVMQVLGMSVSGKQPVCIVGQGLVGTDGCSSLNSTQHSICCSPVAVSLKRALLCVGTHSPSIQNSYRYVGC